MSHKARSLPEAAPASKLQHPGNDFPRDGRVRQIQFSPGERLLEAIRRAVAGLPNTQERSPTGSEFGQIIIEIIVLRQHSIGSSVAVRSSS